MYKKERVQNSWVVWCMRIAELMIKTKEYLFNNHDRIFRYITESAKTYKMSRHQFIPVSLPIIIANLKNLIFQRIYQNILLQLKRHIRKKFHPFWNMEQVSPVFLVTRIIPADNNLYFMQKLIIFFLVILGFYYLFFCLLELLNIAFPFMRIRLMRFLDLLFFKPDEDIELEHIDNVFMEFRIVAKEEAYFLDDAFVSCYSVALVEQRYFDNEKFLFIFVRMQFFYHHKSFVSGLLEPIKIVEDRILEEHFALKGVKSIIYEEWIRYQKPHNAIIGLGQLEFELSIENMQSGFDKYSRYLFLAPYVDPESVHEGRKKTFELSFIIFYFLLFYFLPWFYAKGKRDRTSSINLQRKILQLRQYKDLKIDPLDYRDRFLMMLISG
jgi:hypothetical protein